MGKENTHVFSVSAKPAQQLIPFLFCLFADLCYSLLFVCSDKGNENTIVFGILATNLIFLLPAMWFLLNVLLRVHVLQDGVALRLFGRTVRFYPAAQLRFGCSMQWRPHGYKAWTLPKETMGICLYDFESLVEKASQHWEKSIWTRGELKFRMRHDGWQEKLVRQYLFRRLKKDIFFLWKKDILWIEWSAEREQCIQETYGVNNWIYLPEDGIN